MSRWYSPVYLSNAKKAQRKALLEQNAAWLESQAQARVERDERNARAKALQAERARVDRLVREGQSLGLDRAGICERFNLGAFAVALAERRIAGVTT